MSAELTARYRAARRDGDLCVLEGLHAIKHALRFGAEILDMHASSEATWRNLAHSHAPDIEPLIERYIYTVPPAAFADLAPQAHPTGIIALARRPSFDCRTLWQQARSGPVIILDHPAHAGNTGAVIRTAAAAGATAVLTIGLEDPWHPTVIRGAAGLHFALHVARIDQADLTGQCLIGLDGNGVPIHEVKPDPRSIYVLGSERRGLSAEMRSKLDQKLALPMRQGVSSLNLAASAAILLYQGLQSMDQNQPDGAPH